MGQLATNPAAADLQVKEIEEILFPDGLVGCPNWRRFVLLPGPNGSPVARLQCLSEPSVCFVVMDPRNIVANYALTVPKDELLGLGLDDTSGADVVCTLSVRGEPAVITANLMAPLVMNRRFKIGKQVVLADSGYSTRHPVAATTRREHAHPMGKEG